MASAAEREMMPSGTTETETTPLYVDLDGTVLATDLLWESLLELVRRRPWDAPRVAVWLLRGRAHLKRAIAGRVTLDVHTLPYREDVLTYLKSCREQGRPVVLATASDEQLARAVAEHLGLFDHVIASDGAVNRKGGAKLESIRAHAGERAFDYMGDSPADMPLWRAARRPIVVAPSRRLGAAVRSWAEPDRTEFLAERRGLLKSIVRELRPHQWSKNVLIFVPLLTAHVMRNLHYLLPAMLAFVCFCLTASGVYALNDLLDLPSDRRHTRKRKRPIASGELPIPAALALVVVLFGTASALCLLLPWQFAVLLLGYLVLTTAYSMVLKRKLMVDVLCLAALYTARILAGGLATGIPISPWLMAFSTFFFLSLAFAKRYTELESLVHTTEKVPGRGYWAADLELIRVLGPVSGYLCVLVFCLYISKSDEVARFYAHPDVLWLTCPILLYWISRLWFLAHRGHLPHDPVVFALTDTISYICGGLMLAILASASFKGL